MYFNFKGSTSSFTMSFPKRESMDNPGFIIFLFTVDQKKKNISFSPSSLINENEKALEKKSISTKVM